MSVNLVKPWEMGDEIAKGEKIPNFTKGKFIVVGIKPPKTKTVRDGLVMTAIMLSYINEAGEEIKTVEVTEGPSGYDIKFPNGKLGLLATKYRGAKSFYSYVNPHTHKRYQISSEKFTPEYAKQYLSERVSDWNNMSDAEHDSLIDEYLESMFRFGLAKDFAFNEDESGNISIPEPGMVTTFYRKYTPPSEGERWGNVIISKWVKGETSLDGDIKEFPQELSQAIYDKLQERDDTFKVEDLNTDD